MSNRSRPKAVNGYVSPATYGVFLYSFSGSLIPFEPQRSSSSTHINFALAVSFSHVCAKGEPPQLRQLWDTQSQN